MAIEDDSMPVAYLSEMDQGLYGGLLGANVRFLVDSNTGWISSMVSPLLKDWSNFDKLRFDASHPWWQRYIHQLDVFAARSAGKWGMGHFIVIDAMNFVFELVGATEGYMAVEDRPDMVRQAMDFGYELNVAIHGEFFRRAPTVEGGTFSHFAQWLPGRIVNESLDPYHMASVAYFEKWGREPAERMLTAFDGGVIHLHANGRHLIEAAATLQGLKAIRFMDDKGYAPSLEAIAELKSQAGNVPAVLAADYESFVERLDHHDLPGGVLYQVRNVPDVATANRLMEKVRTYRCSEN
jgi:hypothetical protein